MIAFFKKSIAYTFAIVTGVFTFIPEAFFESHKWISPDSLEKCNLFSNLTAKDINIVISRITCLFFVSILTSLAYLLFLKLRQRIIIKGENYLIWVEYGDILKKRNCKRVINFDECFTTQVGDKIADINPSSICGQYLMRNPDLDIHQQRTRYDSGTIVPNGNDLLMAFAKLDEKGKGRFFSRDEYIQCLELLWKELENYYSEKDICIPILGAGTTSFDGGAGASISQQDLLNMIIWSYKLTSHKIKSPHKLRIICKKNSEFSINNIDA